MTRQWYAVRVRSHFEQTAAKYLGALGYEVFLPTYRERRRWSDRMKEVRVPLFQGYLFCAMDITNRLAVMKTPGVVDVVGFGKEFVPVPQAEIEAVRAMVDSDVFARPYPFLNRGELVKMQRGPLAGVEGILVEMKNEYRLVVSVNLLQRSVSAEVDLDWVRPVAAGRHASEREASLDRLVWDPSST